MKPEHLETLLLDRALNQLAPEVADLLEAHLARDPAAARRAAALAATVGLARESTQLLHERVPPVEARPWSGVRSAWRRRAAGMETLKIAASVAVGLGLALAWRARAPGPALLASQPVALVQPAPAFWSTARVIAEARRDGGRGAEELNRYQPRWLTPAKRPPVEGKQ